MAQARRELDRGEDGVRDVDLSVQPPVLQGRCPLSTVPVCRPAFSPPSLLLPLLKQLHFTLSPDNDQASFVCFDGTKMCYFYLSNGCPIMLVIYGVM